MRGKGFEQGKTTKGPERNFSHDRNIYIILDYGNGYMTFVKTHRLFL